MRKSLSLILALVLMLGMLPLNAFTTEADANPYKGKVISILGDSTSSFEGYTPTNDGFNLEHRDRYPQANLITDVNESWWMQVINELDAKLGVNDSWAGSTVYWGPNLAYSDSDNGEKAAMASLTRIQNLGSNGTPDVILFFGAGNDIRRGAAMGNFDPATAPTTVDLESTKWDTFADSYVAAIMRLQHFYPNSKIVVMLYEYIDAAWTHEEVDAYNAVIQDICDHYGIITIDLRLCDIAQDMFPDGTHPNEEGMDIISDAVIQTLLADVQISSGENEVYAVTHSLQDAEASLHYWKGVSAGTAFCEELSGNDLRVTVRMGGVDITESVYANGVIYIPSVTGELEIIAEADCGLSEHLQQLPDKFCAGVNLWTALTPENIYYTADGWGNLATNTAYSVTFPVVAGDRILASSFGYLPENGNGTRVTWFDASGVLKTVPRTEVYAEFIANGYITAPDGAIALNVPMPSADSKYEIYILNREHSDQNGVCSICGKGTSANPFKGKVISIMGDSISTFDGYIPAIDGFNLGHKTFYPNSTIQNVGETWWMQVINGLDAKLGINESWAGSQVLNQQNGNTDKLGEDAAMASLTRILNLGANGTPDVILFFGGTNDIGRAVPMGNFDPNNAPDTVDLTATKWDSFADAYVAAIMRMQHYYPNAQILVMIPYATSNYYTNAELQNYGDIIMSICDHYGVEYLLLQDIGITTSDLTDGIHPGAEGMTMIANAVQSALKEDCTLQEGETVVHKVTHNTTNVFGSLAYYKGINDRASFTEVLYGENIQITVKMNGIDITDSVYADGVITIPVVTGDVVITASGGCMLNEHLQTLPDNICGATNIWQIITPEQIYYTANGWGYEPVLPNVHSTTIPVVAGDKIWASTFGYLPENGNGTRVTWFCASGVLKSVPRTEVYAEYQTNGYLTVPEGAIAINIPMPSADEKYEIYILNRDHCYENGICTGCGAVLGDLNLDGDVDAEDLTILARHVAGIEVLNDEVILANADVNGNGVVDAEDLTHMARYVAGIVTDWEAASP